MGGQGQKYLNGLQLFLLDEANKLRGVTGVDQSLLDVGNWEVVPGADHYEILEIDTEFQTFLDDFTILDLVGHIITTFRRGI